MRKYKWWLILGVIILAVAVYAVYPSTSRKQNVDFQNVQDIVTSTQKNAQEIKNYKLSIDINAGSIVKVNMTDLVDRQEAKRQYVDMNWDAPQNSGQTTMYSDGKQVLVLNPANKKWVLPSEEPAAAPYLDFFWGQLGMTDPVDVFSNLQADTKNTAVIDKGDSVILEVTPEPADLSDIAKHLPPQFSSAELKDMKQTFTISKQDLLITKYQVTAKIALFGITAMKFNTVTTPSDYNKTVIKLPAALTEKLKTINS